METNNSAFKLRLGLFISVGIALFILAIFVIGKQKNLFNPVFKLRTTFHNVSGLLVGNNVRFSGINVGTVDNIIIVNDSTVMVVMLIKQEVQKFVKSDCIASISSDGIIGDKVVVISQGSFDAPVVTEGQRLQSAEPIETDAIMASLQVTAGNAEIITDQLAEIMIKVNRGRGTLGRLIFLLKPYFKKKKRAAEKKEEEKKELEENK
jgi:phospholipid/cholesterol/gamma-HCH transport system substrate-binding protein